MKYGKYLFLLFSFSFIFMSCSKDDKDDDSYKDMIVGQWDWIETYGEIKVTPDSLKPILIEEIQDSATTSYKEKIEFLKDGKGTYTSTEYMPGSNESYSDTFHYEISRKDITIIWELEEKDSMKDTITYSYEIKNNNLTLKLDMTDEYKDFFKNDHKDAIVNSVIEVKTFKK